MVDHGFLWVPGPRPLPCLERNGKSHRLKLSLLQFQTGGYGKRGDALSQSATAYSKAIVVQVFFLRNVLSLLCGVLCTYKEIRDKRRTAFHVSHD